MQHLENRVNEAYEVSFFFKKIVICKIIAEIPKYLCSSDRVLGYIKYASLVD